MKNSDHSQLRLNKKLVLILLLLSMALGQFILGALINSNPNYVYANSQIPNSSSLRAVVTVSNGKMLPRALLLDRPLVVEILKTIKNNTDPIL